MLLVLAVTVAIVAALVLAPIVSDMAYSVREVLGYFIPIIPKKEHTEDQMWFSGILDKVSVGPFRLLSEEQHSHKMTSCVDDDSDR
jgi:hypothetical protein